MAPQVSVGFFYADADVVVGRLRNVLLLNWRGRANLARAQKVAVHLNETAAEHESMGLVTILEASAPAPDPDVRPYFADGLRKLGGRMRGLAYVVTAGGFGGAATRAAISGLCLLARAPYPTRVFAAPHDASAWLAPLVGGALSAEQVTAAIAQVRAHAV
jgi:hypothetical protein